MFGLNRQEFEQMQRDSEGQRSLACCSSWGCKELETSERLNNNRTSITQPRLYMRYLSYIQYMLNVGRDHTCVHVIKY